MSAEQNQEESEHEKQAKFRRNCRYFIDYINYDWEHDENWTSFKDTHMKDVKSTK